MLNIIKHYKFWFSVSGIILALGIISLAVFHLRLGIDFSNLFEVQSIGPISPRPSRRNGHAGLAQLFRARPCQGRGQGLESPDPHQFALLDPTGSFLFANACIHIRLV